MSIKSLLRKSNTGHKPDYLLAITFFILSFVGVIMIASASVVLSYTMFGTNDYYLRKQLTYLMVGFVFWIIMQRIDYHYWQKLALPLLIATILLLIAVFIPGIGFSYGGAQRWVHIPISVQPAEIAKLTFILYLASWIEKKGEGIRSFSYGFVPFLILLGVVSSLVILEPDMGTMSVIVITASSMFFVAGASIRHVLLGAAMAFGTIWGLIKIAPYRLARFTTFLNPSQDVGGIGYHVNQALLAVGTGGLMGAGFGYSIQKYNYLPEAAGDSIFAIIAEELGFVRSSLIILVFMFIIWRGLKIAKGAPDVFGRMLAVGIVAWFGFQAIVNIGAMIGVLPLTGIPLPFISYGGTSLVVSLAAVGILLNISKQTTRG